MALPAHGVEVDNSGVAPGRRRQRPEAQEIADELAQETPRVTLLGRLEQQLKGRQLYSRLLFSFNIADDRGPALESEFASFRDKHARDDLTGLLIFMQSNALHFLEGTTEKLFLALAFFFSLSAESMPMESEEKRPKGALAVPARSGAVLSAVRVLYFTELHGIRASTSWCSIQHQGKSQGLQKSLEDSCAECTFDVYRKLLELCLRVGAAGETTPDQLQKQYRKASEMMPSIDEILLLVGKSGAEYFLTYKEFEKTFLSRFELVLDSELVWPMQPTLSY